MRLGRCRKRRLLSPYSKRAIEWRRYSHPPRSGLSDRSGPKFIEWPTPELDRLITELGLQSEYCAAHAEANNRFVVRNGQPIALPHSLLSFLRTPLFSTRAKWRLLAEPFIRSKAVPGESLAAFAQRRLGTEPLAYALNPFVSGIYAGDPEALCVETAFPTLLQMEQEHGSLLRALLHRAKQRRRSGEPRKLRTIYSFTQGMQTLPDRLVEKIGDAIQTHHPITSIQQEDEAWMIENQRFSDIILTLPAHAQTQLDTPFDLSFLASIRYPAVTSLSLLYRRDQLTHPLNGFGMLVPACEERFILGVLFPSSIFPDRAPDECALLTVFVGGDRTPERAHLPEADLISRVEADLQDLLGLRGMRNTYGSAVGSRRFRNIPKRSKRATANLMISNRIFQAFILPETIEMGFPLRKP